MTQQEFFDRYTYSVKSDRIGGGGFGTVYRATDKLLHRKVAVKVSEVKIIGDKEFSLKTEFDAVGKLPPHQNIAHYEELYSFDEHNGVFDYAVMQYYEDGNLKQLLESRKLTYSQKEKLAAGILDGIAFLHRNKVVHRDLKPANILICREGDDYVPLITDFGLSKGVEEMSKSGFSNSIAGGSPGYMSPEQIKGGRMQLNTDLWSYGVMVYELFSGRRLFRSASPTGSTAEVNEMILHKDISAEIAALPGKWRDVAERCLVRDNRLRAKSAVELFEIINGSVKEQNGGDIADVEITQQEFFNRYAYDVKSDRIGDGGFGTVYRATDNELNCKVAIKVSEVKIIGDKEFSLKTEFDAVGDLPVHPNIAHYEEFHRFETPYGIFDYAVMQYYEDGNLKNLIDGGGLTMAQKEDIARGILNGIAFLHRNKVVHRDLKPANILICREGDDYVPLITDFCLSKVVGEMSKIGFSNSIAGGSPGYMSPEQTNVGMMQFNTDLWSYGVMVYELFSGRRLFRSASPTGSMAEVKDMILHKDISAEIAALPGKWRVVAERCLVRDNRQRAKSAEELYGIINGGVEGTGHFGYDEVTVVDDPKPQPGPAPRPKQDVTVVERKGDGNRFTVNGVSFEMVDVEGGTFWMGAHCKKTGGMFNRHPDTSIPNYDAKAFNDESPVHEVTLSSYKIGKFEVTQELWEAVMGTTVSQQRDKADRNWPLRGEGGDYPMYYVSWDDCYSFIRKLNYLTGMSFRLPTEAEWEYAARGGSRSRGYKYSGSNSIGDVAWYSGNSGDKTHSVGTKTPNEIGIYDMSGNVFEWCQDWYGSYGSGSQTNPQGPSSGSYRVRRGGSWYGNAQYCRVSHRDGNAPGYRDYYLGFRLAVSQ